MISLDRLNRHAYPEDFTLVINSVPCHVPAFIAELFSPAVSHLRQSDPTVLSYSTATTSSVPDTDLSQFFSYLRTGRSPPSPSDSLSLIQTSLGVPPDPSLIARDLNDSNAVDVLNYKRLWSQDYTREVVYVARHFSSVANLTSLPPEELLIVLESPELSVSTEDWLLEFILEFTRNHPSETSFLEYVRVEHLSQEWLARYVQLVDEMEPWAVGRLWGRMRKLFVRNMGSYEFKFTPGGKICHLSLPRSTKLNEIAGRLKKEFGVPASESLSFVCKGKECRDTDELGGLAKQKVVVRVIAPRMTLPLGWPGIAREALRGPPERVGREEGRVRGPLERVGRVLF
jgi:hypothetical protein